MEKINIIVEKTGAGYSAYTENMSVFTTGEDVPKLCANLIEALSLELGKPVAVGNLMFDMHDSVSDLDKARNLLSMFVELEESYRACRAKLVSLQIAADIDRPDRLVDYFDHSDVNNARTALFAVNCAKDILLDMAKRMLAPKKTKKPSAFMVLPMASVFSKAESEVVALNIMKILARTGDEFRPLTWSEYAAERRKDVDFSEDEKPYFDSVMPYCESASCAALFSAAWNAVNRKLESDSDKP